MFWHVLQASEAFVFAASVCDPFVAYISSMVFELGEWTGSVYLTAAHLGTDPVDLLSRLRVLSWRLVELGMFL
jgi:hypothetical protein